MVVLSVEGISKSYGDRTLFENVSFALSRDDRVGLIGVNGSGKSTLLRILMGQEEADDGRIATAKEGRMEFLSQDPDLDATKNALEAVLGGGGESLETSERYEEACRQLSESPSDPRLVEKVADLGAEMDRVDAWNLESDARAILSRLGIDDTAQSVATMSGGQRKRVALARVLLRPADLLILDEPTNHLDVDVIAWLEGYLANRTAGLLLITHDRYFLDRVTTTILELADQTIYTHRGNYSDFLRARQKRRQERQKREQKRAQLAKKELAWLKRGPKARTTKNKARKKRAEELLETSYAVEERSLEIDTVESRLGKKVVILDSVEKSWGDHLVLDGFTYRLDRRDRLGIVGPNGCGKSTLLDVIAGRVGVDSGAVERGETVVIGYYDQESEMMDPSMRVHDYVTEVAHRIPTSDGWMTATQMLELFLFDRRQQWTYIEKLSGGERRRLYLLRVLMGQPNVLLLDEPTNDLDVDTLAVLEDYLDDFDGAVVTVSHDRYFLDRTAEHLLVFRGGGYVEEIPGNYSYYEEMRDRQRRQEERQKAQREAVADEGEEDSRGGQKTPTPSSGLSYAERKELEDLESRIAGLETRLEELDEKLVASAADYEAVAKLDEEKRSLQAELDAAFERWMRLSEQDEA